MPKVNTHPIERMIRGAAWALARAERGGRALLHAAGLLEEPRSGDGAPGGSMVPFQAGDGLPAAASTARTSKAGGFMMCFLTAHRSAARITASRCFSGNPGGR